MFVAVPVCTFFRVVLYVFERQPHDNRRSDDRSVLVPTKIVFRRRSTDIYHLEMAGWRPNGYEPPVSEHFSNDISHLRCANQFSERRSTYSSRRRSANEDEGG